MPFGFKKENSKSDIDYKARLERKLCLARENPEPIFDLSECNLKAVPSSLYSLCKVFRKEALFLQENQLTNLSGGGLLTDLGLLKVLDISSNKLTKLPADIKVLKNLEVLNVSMNQIQELPESISDLANLHQLNASNNRLKKLPINLGSCKNLQILDIQQNQLLKKLPSSLGKIKFLRQLLIDSAIDYPPQDVCALGLQAIIQFLAQECSDDVSPVQDSRVDEPERNAAVDFNGLQEKLKLLEKLKEENQKQRLALEKHLLDESKRELELHQKSKGDRSKLVEDLRIQQKSLESEIARVQGKKEAERALLLLKCNAAEENANETISKLLQYNRSMREKVSAVSEEERKMEEQYLMNFTLTTKSLEKKSILDSMRLLMKNEIEKSEKSKMDETKRIKAAQTLISEEIMLNDKLVSLMKRSGNDQQELVDSIRRNEELQKTAVAALLEKSDARSWELSKQVNMVQEKLAELTQLELAKKKLETDEHIVELGKNRVALTELLMDLFAQQSERREQLVQALRRMEGIRELDGDGETFWLEQYQRLLDSTSHKLVESLKSLDPELAGEFFLNGVFHYLPVIAESVQAKDGLRNITPKSLERAGVKSEEDQMLIVKAVQSYLKKYEDVEKSPSAPEDLEASAPFLSPSTSFSIEPREAESRLISEDCVICLDDTPDVLFIPCGHMCCCSRCCTSITFCPLCRAPIDQILQATPRV